MRGLTGCATVSRARAPTTPEDMTIASRTEGFGDEVKLRILLGTYVLRSGFQDEYYLRAQRIRTAIRKDFEKAFRGVDLVLMPVYPVPAVRARGASRRTRLPRSSPTYSPAPPTSPGFPRSRSPRAWRTGFPSACSSSPRRSRRICLFSACRELEKRASLSLTRRVSRRSGGRRCTRRSSGWRSTRSFSRGRRSSAAAAPPSATNRTSNVCPVCMGYPGVLPTLNGEAIRMGYLVARALNCTLASTHPVRAEELLLSRPSQGLPDLAVPLAPRDRRLGGDRAAQETEARTHPRGPPRGGCGQDDPRRGHDPPGLQQGRHAPPGDRHAAGHGGRGRGGGIPPAAAPGGPLPRRLRREHGGRLAPL